MSSSNSNKHLTLQERSIIETGIRNRSSKKAIADTLGKDKSTIGKEILSHRQLTKKCNLPLECAVYKTCKHGRNCTSSCPDFVSFHISFLTSLLYRKTKKEGAVSTVIAPHFNYSLVFVRNT